MRWTPKRREFLEWQPWFAWRPVYGIGSGTWFWLEWIERKFEPGGMLDGAVYYRAPRAR